MDHLTILNLTTILAHDTDASGSLSPTTLLIIYCALIGVASLAGGAIAAVVKLGHRRLQFALSFVGGMMLGVGLFHLLTHGVIIALETSAMSTTGGLSHGLLHGALDGVMLALVLGFVVMFLLERFFHFHQHETPEEAGHHDCCDDGCDGHSHAGGKDANGKRGHDGQKSHDGHGGRPKRAVSQMSWIGAAIGLTLHSVIEGVALGAAVLAGVAHDHGGMIAGLSTFLVILLHKPFDGLTVTTLVRAAGKPAGFAHVVNLLFSLVVPVGAAIVWFGVAESDTSILPYALAFSAGTFLCIASSDLLPELQFHRHDRVGLSAALLVGLALAGAIARFESSVAQSHDHHHHHGHSHHDHSHHDHSHHDHSHHDHSHDGHDHSKSSIPQTEPTRAPDHDHDHGAKPADPAVNG
jgi:zinc and cadmium transporter